MVSLRRQLAEILGYPTWADYITEGKAELNTYTAYSEAEAL